MRLSEIPRPPIIAGLCLFAGLTAFVVWWRGAVRGHARAVTRTAEIQQSAVHPTSHRTTHTIPMLNASHRSLHRATGTHGKRQPASQPHEATVTGSPSTTRGLTLPKAIGQLIISTYAGTTPPARILDAVRAGKTGAVILMGDNTAGGILSTREAVNMLQAAARAGGNSRLLIMTDQEGGEVKRLVGPPDYSAAQMDHPELASAQGRVTGQLLREAGVNLDLAPVADVTRLDGFMAQEQRTFGSSPANVANAACAFAGGLEREGVGFTLKHFPGLGDAVASTDSQPVSISEPASEIRTDDAAYRKCGGDSFASVMISSASYIHLTGRTPAVLAPRIYHELLPDDGVHGLTMSDSFESGAIDALRTPARLAINAGLDMVMYPGTESASAYAYASLLRDAEHGSLSASRVDRAAEAVLAYKHTLGLG